VTAARIASAVAVLAAALALVSCGGSSKPGGTTSVARQSPPKVGQTLRVRAGSTTLAVNVHRVTFPLRGSGALLGPGDRAAAVEVSLRNTGHALYDSSSESDVKLKVTSGQFAEPAFASGGGCATTEIDFLKDVEPGESRSGCVAFDVPRGDKPTAVRFEPNGSAASGRTWLVKG
jgi:hypothetical protein